MSMCKFLFILFFPNLVFKIFTIYSSIFVPKIIAENRTFLKHFFIIKYKKQFTNYEYSINILLFFDLLINAVNNFFRKLLS